MTNTNCLSDMQCPKCASFEPFNIEIHTIMRFTDEGVDDDSGNKAWNNDSYCECCTCMFSGTVADFSKTE